MSIFRGYVGAKSCTKGPQKGVVNFMTAALAAISASHSDGIYNCRNVRGSSKTTSLHGEGRAFDWGCKAGAKWASATADYLRLHSKELGIQCIIYNRRIWSGAHSDSGWRPYNGLDSHTTHLHIEFSWAAAKNLTVAQAAHYLEPVEDNMAFSDNDKKVIGDIIDDKLEAFAKEFAGEFARRVWAYNNAAVTPDDAYQRQTDIHNAVISLRDRLLAPGSNT